MEKKKTIGLDRDGSQGLISESHLSSRFFFLYLQLYKDNSSVYDFSYPFILEHFSAWLRFQIRRLERCTYN